MQMSLRAIGHRFQSLMRDEIHCALAKSRSSAKLSEFRFSGFFTNPRTSRMHYHIR